MMHKKNAFLLILIALLLVACNNGENQVNKDESTKVADIYLGQKPPGMVPELFAPDIIKTEFREGAYTFTPDLKEFYFRRRGGEYKNNALVVVKLENNQWTESLVAARSGEPYISPDGKTMHLGKRYRDRTATGWSEVKELGPPFEEYRIMRLTVAASGTYYFDEASESGPLRYARLVDGIYEDPKPLAIDLGDWNAHPYIAPDESYIIWDDQRVEGYGSSDLYISFRLEDGSWGPSINFGNQVNTEFEDAFGSVTPDGKYFFFTRSYGGDKADIFWLDAQIIEKLKPKN